MMREWDPSHPQARLPDPARFTNDDVAGLAQSFRNLALRLQAFVERERHFTRDASHELRTPLTIIKMAVDVLADDPDHGSLAQRSLVRIRRSVREIEALIETFLVLAREYDTGLPEQDFLINDVVREEVERYRDLLGSKSVELKMEETGRFALHAPSRVCTAVVGNLIRNACMHTERGTILVRVEQGGVRVSDTGYGMDAQALERASRGIPADGTALAIVHRIADRFGWPIEMDGIAAAGTTVFLCFPSAIPVDAGLTQAH
ncbi:MAG: HAMP domain-containing histidine kinase [Proteobacteria bacterium]|nr:HAMP domain-containing histidine kinase [Pseudomonadota bacterium]